MLKFISLFALTMNLSTAFASGIAFGVDRSGPPPADEGQTLDWDNAVSSWNGARLMDESQATYDVGAVPVGESRDHAIRIKNYGRDDVTQISLAFDAGPFQFKGDYPGEGGTCGDTIKAGSYCLLGIIHAPTHVGHEAGYMEMRFTDGGAAKSEVLKLTGQGLDAKPRD